MDRRLLRLPYSERLLGSSWAGGLWPSNCAMIMEGARVRGEEVKKFCLQSIHKHLRETMQITFCSPNPFSHGQDLILAGTHVACPHQSESSPPPPNTCTATSCGTEL
mmetsp:Transcript_851/g.1852  ORF Transcript_851/g.1852 Transcript_851/m.1852 type:complete len:107 (+) Transcript_851:507-827(+)